MAQVTAARPLPVSAPRKQRVALPRGFPTFSIAVLVAFVVLAVLAPVIAPHSPTNVSLTNSFRPPVWQEGGTLMMIAEGREVLEKAWWVAAMPGIALSLVILSANIAGDWLRDYLDPTLRHAQS